MYTLFSALSLYWPVYISLVIYTPYFISLATSTWWQALFLLCWWSRFGAVLITHGRYLCPVVGFCRIGPSGNGRKRRKAWHCSASPKFKAITPSTPLTRIGPSGNVRRRRKAWRCSASPRSGAG